MAWFPRLRRHRSIESRIAKVQQARLGDIPILVEELPIAIGFAQLHADLISGLDLRAVDRTTGRPVANQPAFVMQPDPAEDRADTLHKITQALWWGGNAPVSVARAGELSTIRVLNPSTVGYIPDPLDTLRFDWWTVDGQIVPFDRVHNWKMNDDPRRGPLGRSPLVQAAQALALYGWAYRYLLDYFALGGNPSLVLRSTRNLSPGPVPGDPTNRTEAQIAQEDWVTSRQLFRPAVLDPQWELQQGPAPQDLEQTIAVLEFAGQEVGRLANVPPSIANLVAGGTLTYSTTADELRRWLLLSLGPTWLQRIERGFTRILAVDSLVVRFDQDSLTRFDILENAAATANPVAPAQLRAVS
jgi:phage portal protein BeeE